MENVLAYAKFIVAIIGAGVTSALTFTLPDTVEFKYLTVASAVISAILVFAVPNKAADGRHEAGA